MHYYDYFKRGSARQMLRIIGSDTKCSSILSGLGNIDLLDQSSGMCECWNGNQRMHIWL